MVIEEKENKHVCLTNRYSVKALSLLIDYYIITFLHVLVSKIINVSRHNLEFKVEVKTFYHQKSVHSFSSTSMLTEARPA